MMSTAQRANPKRISEPAVPCALGRDDLSDLLRAVNQTTEALQQTHEALRGEVARLKDELAEANRKLKRSQQLAALGEMAAGIAHEIRNPLGSIQLYIQMLSEDAGADAPAQALCGKVSAAVGGIDAIVRDVLMFARDMRIRAADVNAMDILRRVVADCEGLVASHDIDVRIVGDETLTTTADAGLLQQAMGNVVRNAIEAMVEDAQCVDMRLMLSADVCRVRCPDGERADRLVLSVRDNGPGIAEEVLARMFNPFFTTRSTGTGLGLAIVHRIVDAHGGHVDVKAAAGKSDGVTDDCVERGTTVAVCLPLRISEQPDLQRIA